MPPEDEDAVVYGVRKGCGVRTFLTDADGCSWSR